MEANLMRMLGSGLDFKDDFALNEQQRRDLNRLKIEMKLRNENYFRDHPELQCLVTFFLEETFVKKPDDLHKFCSDFFTRPDLRRRVQDLLAQSYPPPIQPEPEIDGSISSEEIDLCRPQDVYPWDQAGSYSQTSVEASAKSSEGSMDHPHFFKSVEEDSESESS